MFPSLPAGARLLEATSVIVIGPFVYSGKHALPARRHSSAESLYSHVELVMSMFGMPPGSHESATGDDAEYYC